MATDFVDVLNGLNSLPNADIYVSGSNAKLLSKDIVTEFRGRGDEVKIYPLNFGEYWSVYEGNKFRALDEFMLLVLYPRFLKERMKNRRHIF